MSQSPCPLCGMNTAEVVTDQLRRGRGIVFRCNSCDFEFLERLDHGKGDGYWDRVCKDMSPEEVIRTYAGYQLRRLNSVRPLLGEDKRLLEIGSGPGQFLYHLEGECSRNAVEPDKRAHEYLEGVLHVPTYWSIAEAISTGRRYDVICCFQALEHMDDPIGRLKEMKRLLKDDGTLFIEVPNLHDGLLSIWGNEAYRRFYYHSDHLSYFSERAITLAGSRAGFSSISVEFRQDYNMLNHVHWLLNHEPQKTPHPGMGPLRFDGSDKSFAFWFSDAMTKIATMYEAYLVDRGQTDNMWVTMRG